MLTRAQIERRLEAALKQVRGCLPADQAEEVVALLRAGEPGIGLENLCTQLFELDVSVPRAVIVELGLLGRAMGIAPDYWEQLTILDDSQDEQ